LPGTRALDFEPLWRFLEGLAESEFSCSCREGTRGPPLCSIRKCAPEKGVDACPFCDGYPYERILGLAKDYVMMLADGKRMKEIGLDRWIDEQEERRTTGFASYPMRAAWYCRCTG